MNKKTSASRRQGRPVAAAETIGRDVLVEITIDLLRKLPAARVTRTEVARAAGVHPSLIGYYFGTRDALLLAAVDRLSAQAQEVDTQAGPSAADQLAEGVRAAIGSPPAFRPCTG